MAPSLKDRRILPQIFIIAFGNFTSPAGKHAKGGSVFSFFGRGRGRVLSSFAAGFVYFSAPSNTLINQPGKRAKNGDVA